MTGYCDDCGNTMCICDDEDYALTFPEPVRVMTSEPGHVTHHLGCACHEERHAAEVRALTTRAETAERRLAVVIVDRDEADVVRGRREEERDTARRHSAAWKRLAKRYRWHTPADVASSNGYGAGLAEAAEQAEHLAEGHGASGAEIAKALRHFADEWTEGKPVDVLKALRAALAAAEADLAIVRAWGAANAALIEAVAAAEEDDDATLDEAVTLAHEEFIRAQNAARDVAKRLARNPNP